MGLSILEIDNQRFSTLFASYFSCSKCGYVTDDLEILNAKSPCKHCGSTNHRAYFHFRMGVLIMVDLMQEYYHLQPSESPLLKALGKGHVNHLLAIIIYYCSLGELLFEDFLVKYMIKASIPSSIQGELLKDISMDKRLGLFHALTGKRFKTVVKQLSQRSKVDYNRVVSFYLQVRNERNTFLHTGNKFLIKKDMIDNCLIDTPSLIQLFVDIHNLFIAKRLLEIENEKPKS